MDNTTRINGQKMSENEFLALLEQEYDGTITCNDKYINARTPIAFYCHCKDENGIEHGEFKKSPYEIIRKHRHCPICMGRIHHKPFGYWNVKTNCEEFAKTCKNKNEMQRKSYGAYHAACKNKWLDEFETKYFNKEIQYRDLNERVHVVYAYLFDELKICYIGRTSNLRRRHRQHKNGVVHTNKVKEFDNLYKFCEKHHIEMPYPHILAESLTATESQIQEEVWLKQYISDGWTPLNKGKVGLNKGSLGAVAKWTYDLCKEAASKYLSKEEFKKKCVGAYNAARREGWIYEFFTEDLKLPNGYWDDLENCQKEALKYRNFKDMSLKGGASCYNKIRKHKWQHLIKFKE